MASESVWSYQTHPELTYLHTFWCLSMLPFCNERKICQPTQFLNPHADENCGCFCYEFWLDVLGPLLVLFGFTQANQHVISYREFISWYWGCLHIHICGVCLYISQFSSVAQSCLTLWDSMNHSTPGLHVHHQLPEFTETHVHQVSDAIQPSHPLSFPSPPAPNPSQHQGLFQWINSSHEVAKVLEFQPQHQSFQWTPRTGLL